MVTGTRSESHKNPEWLRCSVSLCDAPLPPSSPLPPVAEFARLRLCTLLSCRFPSRVHDGRRGTVASGRVGRLPTVAVGHVTENSSRSEENRGMNLRVLSMVSALALATVAPAAAQSTDVTTAAQSTNVTIYLCAGTGGQIRLVTP